MKCLIDIPEEKLSSLIRPDINIIFTEKQAFFDGMFTIEDAEQAVSFTLDDNLWNDSEKNQEYIRFVKDNAIEFNLLADEVFHRIIEQFDRWKGLDTLKIRSEAYAVFYLHLCQYKEDKTYYMVEKDDINELGGHKVRQNFTAKDIEDAKEKALTYKKHTGTYVVLANTKEVLGHFFKDKWTMYDTLSLRQSQKQSELSPSTKKRRKCSFVYTNNGR